MIISLIKQKEKSKKKIHSAIGETPIKSKLLYNNKSTVIRKTNAVKMRQYKYNEYLSDEAFNNTKICDRLFSIKFN